MTPEAVQQFNGLQTNPWGTDTQLFTDIFANAEYLTGDKKAPKPPLLDVVNDDIATDILLHHLKSKSDIDIHTDVDLDGAGSAKILTEWIRQKYHCLNTRFFINKERVHGISARHVEYFNQIQSKLVIILDSSSNEIELLSQMYGDVIVLDHHKLQVAETTGKTKTGTWVVVNYMNPDNNYKERVSLSAGMEVYEFLRKIDAKDGTTLLEDKALYQWAVATLFSDHINNDNLRNIYWINKAFTNLYKEPSIKIIFEQLGRQDIYLSKSNIGYTLAPAFNRAVRAGASSEALDYILNNPTQITNLTKYKEVQDSITANFEVGAYDFERYIIKDITYTNVHPNYAGLIATKLLDKYSKTTVVFRNDNGLLCGSFRGKSETFDYCECIANMGFFASGHPNAFGFKIPCNYMQSVMETVVSHELAEESPYLVYGDTQIGKHNIESLSALRESGNLWKLGVVNSFLTTDVNIVAPSYILKYVRSNNKGTCYTYEIEGLEFTAFQLIVTGQCLLYVEYQDSLKLYVKNKWR